MDRVEEIIKELDEMQLNENEMGARKWIKELVVEMKEGGEIEPQCYKCSRLNPKGIIKKHRKRLKIKEEELKEYNKCFRRGCPIWNSKVAALGVNLITGRRAFLSAAKTLNNWNNLKLS